MAQLNFAIPDALLLRLDAAKPDYLDRKGFLCLLIDQALDRPITLGVVSGSEQLPSSSSSLTSNCLKHKKEVRSAKVKRTKGTPDFEEFWRVYQSCEKKANTQSKVKAWECWEQLVPDVEPSALISAAQKAVEEVRKLQRSNDFCSPLPDAFRWLRDERYAVLLEEHSPSKPRKLTPEEDEAEFLRVKREIGLL